MYIHGLYKIENKNNEEIVFMVLQDLSVNYIATSVYDIKEGNINVG